MKAYKASKDVPLWNPKTLKKADMGEESTDEESDDGQDDKDKASAGSDSQATPGQASRVVEGAASSNVGADEDKGPTKEKSGAQQLKTLRLNHKNTVLVAAAISCKDNFRSLVAIILELCRPMWTDHSHWARSCRAPESVFNYDMVSALGQFMSVLETCAQVLMDVTLLRKIGFEMSFGAGLPDDLSVTSPLVQTEGINATHMVDLFCALCTHRISSMGWHFMSWPGKAVLLGLQMTTSMLVA
jgi:hypothetical protein